MSNVRDSEGRGRRPVLILSRDEFNERSQTVTAVAMTSRPQRAGFPLTLRLPDDTLDRDSWVKSSQMPTLSLAEYSGPLQRPASPFVAAFAPYIRKLPSTSCSTLAEEALADEISRATEAPRQRAWLSMIPAAMLDRRGAFLVKWH